MERLLVLASHGKFASGIFSSLKLICGVKENIITMDCYLTEDFDLNQAVSKVMDENKEKEVVVVTDLFGGSVNNEFLTYIKQPNFYLVAGMNLPFLIEFITQFDFTDSVPNLIEQTLNTSKETIQFCNKTFEQELVEEEF